MDASEFRVVGRSVSVRTLLPAVAALDARSADSGLGDLAGAALAAVHLARRMLDEPDRRLSVAALHAFWRTAVQLGREPALGLDAALRIRSGTFEVFGQTLRHSLTLGDAIIRANRLSRIVDETMELALYVEGDRVTYAHVVTTADPAPAALAEYRVAAIAALAASISAHPQAVAGMLTEVRFTHARPADTRRHESLFAAPIVFDAPHNALVFPASVLHLPCAEPDPAACARWEAHAQAQLAALPEPATFSQRVKTLLTAELSSGRASVELIASRLKVSSRTLSRRLEEEGTSYQRLLDDLRHGLAVRYLGEPDVMVAEVAFLLGFSDSSAFYKAFHRWTGVGPEQYRRQHGLGLRSA
jgi:AraC-like DNA-binding protein